MLSAERGKGSNPGTGRVRAHSNTVLTGTCQSDNGTHVALGALPVPYGT